MTLPRYRTHQKRTSNLSNAKVRRLFDKCPLECQEKYRELGKEVVACSQSRVELKALLGAVVELTPLPIAIVCLESDRLLLQNQRVAPFFGMNQDTGDRLSSQFYVNESDRHQLIAKLERGESIIDREIRLKRHNGEQFDALISGKLVDYESTTAAILIWTDISQQRQTQNLNNLLATAVHHAADGIEISDGEAKSNTSILPLSRLQVTAPPKRSARPLRCY